jgi:hypothetical protein
MRRGQKTTRWRQSASGYLLEQGQVDLIRLQMHSLLISWIDWSCHHTHRRVATRIVSRIVLSATLQLHSLLERKQSITVDYHQFVITEAKLHKCYRILTRMQSVNTKPETNYKGEI